MAAIGNGTKEAASGNEGDDGADGADGAITIETEQASVSIDSGSDIIPVPVVTLDAEGICGSHEGCGLGYWKNHLDAWVGTDFATEKI